MVCAIAAPAAPPHASEALAVVGFTQVPNTVVVNTALSPHARFLYIVLLEHARARTGYRVRVGYARLCLLMDAGEDLVRRAMAALVDAGLVEQARRGRGLVNEYRLCVTVPPKTRPCRVPEPDETGFSVEEQEDEEQGDQFEFSSAPTPTVFAVDPAPTPASTSAPMPPTPSDAPAPPAPPVSPQPLPDPARDAVLALVGDMRRELGDRATVDSTTSRARNLWRSSGATWEEFATAVYSARAATQARTGAIRDRDATGAHKMGYFFAVLADRLGMRAAPMPPPAPEPVVLCAEPSATPPPPVPHATPPLPPPEAPDGERAAFWERLRAETGIGDLQAYCQACGRPPVYDDLARSVGIVRQRRRC